MAKSCQNGHSTTNMVFFGKANVTSDKCEEHERLGKAWASDCGAAGCKCVNLGRIFNFSEF